MLVAKLTYIVIVMDSDYPRKMVSCQEIVNMVDKKDIIKCNMERSENKKTLKKENY